MNARDFVKKSFMSIEEAIAGLKAGRTLVVDRRDCPILPSLLKLEEEGKVILVFNQVDDQYGVLKFKWRI